MAHPLRQRILVELNVREHARAADLAKALGEPANSISFHLRVLAKHRFIEEAPELARDKRDRVWRPMVEQFVIDRDIAGAERAIDPYTRWLRDMFLRDRGGPEEKDDFREGAAKRAVPDDPDDPDDPDRKYYQVLFAVGPRDLGTAPTPKG